MVVLHVKQEESLFLYETSVNTLVADTLINILQLYNGQSKVKRICSELKCLIDYGVYLPPDPSNRLNNELKQLNIGETDKENCSDFAPTGGYEANPDPSHRRTGQRPKHNMREILTRTMFEALTKISNENVQSNTCLTNTEIGEALEMLKGAVKIVYEIGLPEYDPIQMEFENNGNNEKDPDNEMKSNASVLWFSNKKLSPEKKLSDYFGNNEKSKVIVKLFKESAGPPEREPAFNEKEREKMTLEDQKRKQELLNLETICDSSSSDTLRDKNELKKRMHGIQAITWK